MTEADAARGAEAARVFRGRYFMHSEKGRQLVVFVSLEDGEARALRAALGSRPEGLPITLALGPAAAALADLAGRPS